MSCIPTFFMIHYYIMESLEQKMGLRKLVDEVEDPNQAQNALLPGFPGYDFKDVATLDYTMDIGQLTVNDFTKIGVGINRWQYLFFNPQKNCIEPFKRIGQNSVLPVLDAQAKNCFPTYKAQEQVQGPLAASNQVVGLNFEAGAYEE